MKQEFQRLLSAFALLAAGLTLAPTPAVAAGGAFAVDDAEIGKPGDCEVNAWASFASNGNRADVFAPTCVVKLGIPVELGGILQRSRDDSAWSTSGTLTGKVNLIPVDGHPFGLGLAGGSSWDLVTGASTGGFIYLPATIEVRDNFRVNVNGGWLYDGGAKINYLTWGAGFEWNFVKPLTLIGEVFGQVGSLPAGDPGDPPSPNSIRQPRTQIGLRYTPQEKIDLDLIWGRNITGENSNWVTLGVNLRF